MPNPEARVDPASEDEFLAQLYKGGELLAAGNVAAAKDHLERAYSLHPKNEKAQNLLGLTYFKLGIYDRAAHLYERLVLDNPADPTLRVNLGLVYLKSNDLPRSIREFETATDLSPEHKKAHNYLGLALAQTGEYARAREHFVMAGSDQMAEKMARAVAAGAPPPKAVQVPIVEAPPPPPRREAEESHFEVMSEDERPAEDAAPPPFDPAHAREELGGPPPPPDEESPPQQHDRTQAMFVVPPELQRDDEPPPEKHDRTQAMFVVPPELQRDDEPPPPEKHDRTQHMFVVPPEFQQDEPRARPVIDAAPMEAPQVRVATPIASEEVQPPPPPPESAPPAPVEQTFAAAPQEEEMRFAEDEGPPAPPMPEQLAEVPAALVELPPVQLAEEPAPLQELAPVQVVEELPVVEATTEVPVEVFSQAELPTPRAWDAPAEPGDAAGVYAVPQPEGGVEPGASGDGALYEAQGQAEAALMAPPDGANQAAELMAPPAGAEEAAAGFLEAPLAEPAASEAAPQDLASAIADAGAQATGSEVAVDGGAPPAPELVSPETMAMPGWLEEGSNGATHPEVPVESLEPPPPPQHYDAWSHPVVDAATPVVTPAVSPDGTWGESAQSEPVIEAAIDAAPLEAAPLAAPPAWHERQTVKLDAAQVMAARPHGEVITAQPEAVAPPPHVDFVPEVRAEGTDPAVPAVERQVAPPPELPPADPSYAGVGVARLAEIGPSLDWSRNQVSGPFLVNRDGLALQVRGELLSRLTGLVAVVGTIDAKPEMRKFRGRASDQPFGEGANQLQRVIGHGMLYLEPGRARFHAINLDDDAFYVKEDLVFSFEEAVAFENGKLSADGGLAANMLHLKGQGQVLLRLEGELKTMAIPAGAPLVVPLARLVGWYGLVNPRLKGFVGQGAVELNGEGYALLVAPG